MASVFSSTTIAKSKTDAVVGVEAIHIRCFDGYTDDVEPVLRSVEDPP